MAAFFIDTSALAKRYVAEVGSAWLRPLLHPVSGHVWVLARITAVELIAALTRRERGGALAPADAIMARQDFRTHLAGEYQIVEVDEAVSTGRCCWRNRMGCAATTPCSWRSPWMSMRATSQRDSHPSL